MPDPCDVTRDFIMAYGTGEVAGLRQRLAEDFVGYVTNADAGVDRVDGPDAYVSRLPDLAAAGGSARVTQCVQVSTDQALTMVEIRAQRDGRDLHNFGAFLSRVDADGRICELWMVDALPSYSDEFWS